MSGTKRALLAVAILAAAALLFVWVRRSSPDAALGARIEAVARKGPGTVVRFGELTDFEWDRIQVFGPYTDPGAIDKELGFSWPGARATGIRDSDSFTLLVFVHDGSVVRHVRQSRTLSFPRISGRLPRVRASFVVHGSEPGWIRLVPDAASASAIR